MKDKNLTASIISFIIGFISILAVLGIYFQPNVVQVSYWVAYCSVASSIFFFLSSFLAFFIMKKENRLNNKKQQLKSLV